jgi:hypothetical protein
MLVRPSARARTRPAYKTCLRTPQREDAAPKSPEARRQFTRTEPSPAGMRETMRRRARQRGTNAKRVRCADAPTRQHGTAESSSLGSSPRRDRHRARDRRAAAAGRAGLPLPLCVSLPALGRSTTRSTVSSSGTRSARAALLGHHSGRRGGGGRGNIHTKNHIAGVPGG